MISKYVFVLGVLYVFSFSLDAQESRLHYHAVSIFGHSGIYHGQNHLARDFDQSVNFGQGFRYGIGNFGLTLQAQGMRQKVIENSVLIANSTHVNNRIISLTFGFATDVGFGVLEPRMHLARHTTRFSRDYKNRNLLAGTGFKYGINLGIEELYFFLSADYLWNLTSNISAPDSFKRYMNETRFLMLQLGVELRVFDN